MPDSAAAFPAAERFIGTVPETRPRKGARPTPLNGGPWRSPGPPQEVGPNARIGRTQRVVDFAHWVAAPLDIETTMASLEAWVELQ